MSRTPPSLPGRFLRRKLAGRLLESMRAALILTTLVLGSAPAVQAVQAGPDGGPPGGFTTVPMPISARTQASIVHGSLSWQGRERTYRLYVPGGYDAAAAAPLVFVLHGGGGTGDGIARGTGFDAQAESGGFLAVYPDATSPAGGTPEWDDGRPEGSLPSTHGVDDAGFIGALLDRLESDYAVDSNRVYATGISNGAMMSYRLACELADRIAAVAPVSGTLTLAGCSPSRPVSVIHFHGTADTYVPYQGGRGFNRTPRFELASVPQVIGFWAATDGCASDPEVVSLPSTTDPVTRESYTGCTAGSAVTLYIITGGLHAWPGGLGNAATGGVPTRAVSATPLIWEFFQAHPLLAP